MYDIKGIFVPNEILSDKDLTYTDKMVFSIIRSFNNSKKGCIVSNDYFSKALGKTDRTITRVLSNLVKKGHIRRITKTLPKADGGYSYHRTLSCITDCGSKGLYIDNEILLNTKIKDTKKLIVSMIKYYKDDVFSANNNFISERLGVEKSTIKRYITSLIKYGIINSEIVDKVRTLNLNDENVVKKLLKIM